MLREARRGGRPAHLTELPWPTGLCLFALAPHPDDFDAIAVTMRFFRDRGDELRLGVVTLSPGGVEDAFCSPPTNALKSALREREQRDSCRFFGLPEDRIAFLGVPEDDAGRPIEDAASLGLVGKALAAAAPELVFLPHGNDSNAGHRFTFRALERYAASAERPVAALLNRDPKTLAMRPDVYMFFDEGTASWKAEMLRCHRSQQQRNLNLRGYGFDERILRTNREAAGELPGRGRYAEAFEIWIPEPGGGRPPAR